MTGQSRSCFGAAGEGCKGGDFAAQVGGHGGKSTVVALGAEANRPLNAN